MKKQFFIANWKSNKTIAEAISWFEEARNLLLETATGNREIILCPPFPLLAVCKEYIVKFHLPIALGAQTVSSYPEGTFTGEVSARLLKDYVTYVLIGHSERRRFFHETDENIVEKIKLSLAENITPILLVGDADQVISSGVSIVIYEPPSAISTESQAHAQDPQIVEKITDMIKQKNGVSYVLYGGSVGVENVQEYTRLPSVNGVIIGRESLNPLTFSEIIKHA